MGLHCGVVLHKCSKSLTVGVDMKYSIMISFSNVQCAEARHMAVARSRLVANVLCAWPYSFGAKCFISEN